MNGQASVHHWCRLKPVSFTNLDDDLDAYALGVSAAINDLTDQPLSRASELASRVNAPANRR
jgi:hypothetical protein